MTEHTINWDAVSQIVESAPTTILNVTDAERGTFTEQKIMPRQRGKLTVPYDMLPYPRKRNGHITISESEATLIPQNGLLLEATGRLDTKNFPTLLRSGLRMDVFSGYRGLPLVWQQLVGEIVPSDKPQEEYLLDGAIGLAPRVEEGEPYPVAATNLHTNVVIHNYKHGFAIPVTMEMRMFDQTNKVRDLAQSIGRSLALTEEYAVADVLTTTANYTASNTNGDNDEATVGSGANQQTLTFSAIGLEGALNILMTMKDQKSGRYLGVMPNILWCAPKALWAVKKLINAAVAVRTHGNTTAEIYGTGEMNPFFGIVSTIVSSPVFGNGYEWGLMDTSQALKFQRVMDIDVGEPVFDPETDTYKYYARTFFGVGFKDQRFAFFSDSTTRPTVS